MKVLRSGEPGILGVYANLMTRGSVVRILQAAKEAGWKTIVGGPEPASYIDEYLSVGADVVVIGEGEITLEELLPILRRGSFHLLGRVNGIAFRGDDGRVHRTPPRPQIPEYRRANPGPAVSRLPSSDISRLGVNIMVPARYP